MTGPDPIEGHPTPGMHIWGWMTPPELNWLMGEARHMESIVEIGSLRGRSAFALLSSTSGPVYCIDPWDDIKDESYPAFMEACGHFPNLVAIRGRSPAVADQVPGDVDMVFVDGDHSYASIADDVREWFPRTRKLICGHDYHSEGYPDVTQFVHDYFGAAVKSAPLEGYALAESSIWYVRPR